MIPTPAEVDKIFAALDEATGGLWGDWSFGERDADDLNNIIYKAKNFCFSYKR